MASRGVCTSLVTEVKNGAPVAFAPRHQIAGVVILFGRDIIRLHHESRFRRHIEGGHPVLAGVDGYQCVLHIAEQGKLRLYGGIRGICVSGIEHLYGQLPVLLRVRQRHGPGGILFGIVVYLFCDGRRGTDSPLELKEDLIGDLGFLLGKLQHPVLGLLDQICHGFVPDGVVEIPIGVRERVGGPSHRQREDHAGDQQHPDHESRHRAEDLSAQGFVVFHACSSFRRLICGISAQRTAQTPVLYIRHSSAIYI